MRIIAAICILLAPFTVAADEWADTCRLAEDFGVTCDRVAPPPVVQVRFTDQRRDKLVDAVIRHGGILIRESLTDGVYRSSVLVHEMVHYLLHEKDLILLQGNSEQVCRSEGYAYAVSNRYLKEQGRRDLMKKQWWTLYKHCNASHDRVTLL